MTTKLSADGGTGALTSTTKQAAISDNPQQPTNMYTTDPKLADLAQQTLKIIQEGKYSTSTGEERFIARRIDQSVNYTSLIDVPTVGSLPEPHKTTPPIIQVTVEATVSALRRLYSAKSQEILGCLNFASAKHPCGGWLKGTMAQEEALAYASSLYPSLITHNNYYERHNKLLSEGHPPLYSDRIILSPDVVFFRDASQQLLHQPFEATVITCAAPRTAVIKEQYLAALYLIPEMLKQRMEGVFQTAIRANIRYFVLGAWGCGVFGNNPMLVALLFQQMIAKYGNHFEHIIFAIYGDKEDENYKAFAEVFI